MKLTIIGTGYVGLVTGTCFAEGGHQVICVDKDAEKVKLLQAGGMPIYEPGLEDLVKRNVAAGRLNFTHSTQEGVKNSDVILDRKSTRLNSSHSQISYAVFCLKKKKKKKIKIYNLIR